MELYILRHAIAVEHGASGYEDDTKRPLTAEGRKKLRRIAQGLRKMDLAFDLILSSPYVRARQTAELVAEIFDAEKRLKFSEHLASDGEPEDLIDQVRRLYHSPDSVLLVGHEPYLSKLISKLLTGGEELSLLLKKAGLCKLSVRRLIYGKCATLEWLLAPRNFSV